VTGTVVAVEEKTKHIMTKLERLTGRRESLEEIGPLLHAKTAEEALRNGRILRAADHLKRVYGGRPTVVWGSTKTTCVPVPVLLGSSGMRRQPKAAATTDAVAVRVRVSAPAATSPSTAIAAAAIAGPAATTAVAVDDIAEVVEVEHMPEPEPLGDSGGSGAAASGSIHSGGTTTRRQRAMSQLSIPAIKIDE
jgi:hypothetical protein